MVAVPEIASQSVISAEKAEGGKNSIIRRIGYLLMLPPLKKITKALGLLKGLPILFTPCSFWRDFRCYHFKFGNTLLKSCPSCQVIFWVRYDKNSTSLANLILGKAHNAKLMEKHKFPCYPIEVLTNIHRALEMTKDNCLSHPPLNPPPAFPNKGMDKKGDFIYTRRRGCLPVRRGFLGEREAI